MIAAKETPFVNAQVTDVVMIAVTEDSHLRLGYNRRDIAEARTARQLDRE